MLWFTYMLKCSDESLYTGITTDIQRREQEHNTDPKGAKYTRMRRPVKVVYYEKALNRSRAAIREAELKRLSRKEKLLLIGMKKR